MHPVALAHSSKMSIVDPELPLHCPSSTLLNNHPASAHCSGQPCEDAGLTAPWCSDLICCFNQGLFLSPWKSAKLASSPCPRPLWPELPEASLHQETALPLFLSIGIALRKGLPGWPRLSRDKVRPDHLPLHPASCRGALWQEKRFLLITQVCFVGEGAGGVGGGGGGGGRGAWFAQRLTQRSKEAGD